MKFFTVIFSIYILALSVLPCSDAYNDCNSNTALTENSQNHDHNTDLNDICSPFCTCTCCSISANPKFTPFSIKIAKVVAVSLLKFPNREFSFASNFYGNIWQPPKIS